MLDSDSIGIYLLLHTSSSLRYKITESSNLPNCSVGAIAVKGLSPKYSSVEEESSRNALYASTSPTGESTSGLVIKTFQYPTWERGP